MPQIGSNEIGRQFSFSCLPFFMNRNNISFFHSMGNFPVSMHDLIISSKGFRTDSPQTFNVRILIISWQWVSIWIKIFDNFRNVTFRKRDRRKTNICFFKRIGWKFTSIVDCSDCLVRKLLKIAVFSLKSVM